MSFILKEIDDGHKPTHLKHSITQLRIQLKSQDGLIVVHDNILDDSWRTKAYELAAVKSKPWGECISMAELCNSSINIDHLWMENPQKAVALVSARALLRNNQAQFCTSFEEEIDVIAVWCLTSGVSNEVEYHIDFAELHRYETNIIQPPLYAGTLHLSPFFGRSDMCGGDLCVNTGGLDHYIKFGYKGKLMSSGAMAEDLKSNEKWVTVPYMCNRGTIFDGNMPHLATKVSYIREGFKRVILGFNCFPAGPAADSVRRAPEHSDAFNRTVRLYQTMSSTLQVRTTSKTDVIVPKKSSPDADLGGPNVVQLQDCGNGISDPSYNIQPINTINNNIDDDSRVGPLQTYPIHSKYSEPNGSGLELSQSSNTSRSGSITLEAVRRNPFLRQLIVKAARALKENSSQAQCGTK